MPEPGLTLDEIFATSDECASEPIPPRSDQHEYVLRAGEGRLECDCDGEQVTIRATGDLMRIEPIVADQGRLSLEELTRTGEELRTPEAFRPTWLDLMTAPHIRPRVIPTAIAVPMKLLSMELCLFGYPWSGIGKVFISRPGQRRKAGSGVLVGPNLVLTASHMMPWDTDQASIRFCPGYLSGNNPDFGDAYVERYRGVVNDDDVTGLDYVICKLNWRIGDRTGWLGSQWTSDEDWYYDNSWISVGYPKASPSGGEAPSLEMPAWVRDLDNESDGLEIETNNFTSGGWSGGPLWGWHGGQPRVVGIASGHEKDGLDPRRGVFAGGQHMVNLVKYGWANWA